MSLSLKKKRKLLIPSNIAEFVCNSLRLDYLKGKNVVHPDHHLVKRIEMIGNRITRTNGLPDYEYILIDSTVINAFVFPSKTVFVNTGILPVFGNDAGAALVISHELSHVLLGHGMNNLLFITPLTLFAKLFGGDFLSIIIDLVVSLPFSRRNEIDADTLGLHMFTKACFSSDDGINFFKAMESHEKVKVDYLSTHPSWTKRVNNLHTILSSQLLKSLERGCQKVHTKKDAHYEIFSRVRPENLPIISSEEYEVLLQKKKESTKKKLVESHLL